MTLIRSLDELAMEYVLLTHGVNSDKYYGLMQNIIPITDKEQQAQLLIGLMDTYHPYSVQEAIKAAEKTIKLIYPEG